jgi:putative membrane protein
MANLLRGMTAGLLAGCAASYLMNQLSQTPQQKQRGKSNERATRARSTQRQSRQGGQEAENATVATAEVISKQVFHHELSEREKQIAGPAVHYAYGSLVGPIYGGLAEWFPIVGAGFGLPCGFALWLLGDEIAVPALGLSKGPTEYPPEVHADALAAHLVYGMTTDLMRRVLRHIV